jgi:hypothetical protein
MAQLSFLQNPADEAEGLSEAGIETFRDQPFWAVARETGQNSRDARQGDVPVVVRIERSSLPAADFPSRDQFVEAARQCLALAKKNRNAKETAFFEQACRVLGGGGGPKKNDY